MCGGCGWGCVVFAFLESLVVDRIGMAASRLHGLPCGEEAGARNLVFFRVKWLQATMQGTLGVRRVRLGPFHARIGSSSVFCN